jgi:hypothetical protein
MRLPFVSRLAFDLSEAARQRAEERADAYHADLMALKAQGWAPRAIASIHQPPPEPETEVKRKAGAVILAEKIQRETGASAERALAEAEKMLGAVAPGPFTQGAT